MSNSTSIRENIAAIRAQIDAAARETGRTGADIIHRLDTYLTKLGIKRKPAIH